MSVVANYRLISQNLDRSLTTTANQAPVKLESDYYRENASKVSSIEEFVADTRLFRFAMTAFGLGELAYAKGYMRKILEEGVSDPDSLANRTTDVRIREFAQTFDFVSFGETTMTRTATLENVVSLYIRQNLEENAAQDSGEGVRLALYFERQSSEITSAFDILADPALFEVVRVALGLPSAFSAIDIDKQAAILEDRLDIEDFSDPAKLDDFLTRFAAVWDATEAPVADPIVSLFTNTQSRRQISLELALSLQTIRLGGR